MARAKILFGVIAAIDVAGAVALTLGHLRIAAVRALHAALFPGALNSDAHHRRLIAILTSEVPHRHHVAIPTTDAAILLLHLAVLGPLEVAAVMENIVTMHATGH